MGPRAVVLSYRLGGTDGVSIESDKWVGALRELGFALRRVAGEFSDVPARGDREIPALRIDGTEAPDPETVAGALGDDDLVVVENLCSLPLHESASRVVADVLATRGGRVVLRHHDLPWQRERFAHVRGIPPDIDDTLHVTINERSRRELADRGIDAVTIPNSFDTHAPAGDRTKTRERFGFEPGDVVVLQPTRAIERKNVPGGIGFATALSRHSGRRVRYWLTGPAEEGYGPTLDSLLAGATIPCTTGRTAHVADAYAASDVVVFPSTVEGFGNPIVETALARRPLVAGRYPVLDELAATGLRWFRLEDLAAVAAWLADPDPGILDRNRAVAAAGFGLSSLPDRLTHAFNGAGWRSW